VTVMQGTFEKHDCDWKVVCVAPCVARVDRDGFYRHMGRELRLPADAIDVTLGARAHDEYAGLIIGAVGIASLIGGLVVASIGFGDVGTPTPTIWSAAATPPAHQDGGLTEVVAGSVFVGAGVLAIIIGFAVHYANIRF
jgi:hypothetical protein